MTPGWRRSKSCAPQKHPPARIARSVEAMSSSDVCWNFRRRYRRSGTVLKRRPPSLGGERRVHVPLAAFGAHGFDGERAGGKRAQQLVLRHREEEPMGPVPGTQNDHLAVVIGR